MVVRKIKLGIPSIQIMGSSINDGSTHWRIQIFIYLGLFLLPIQDVSDLMVIKLSLLVIR